ncbi:tetratricopeptide repeat protein [Chryseobacterium caseinilyticum]|uniref:Tetratricopeptide repeat protein n=1 Tax=Chryseobacterium caseinilyticum TaxID=2771428 RepID=A0ABR8ZCH8_9FLAO|nr:tetratricopeptide repeat protein [Chryseobacterium caseinilyticum]MBD8082997.1 tetratricopeptide repeat protein [Chryseobacterium caseinilyticum]
MTKTVFITICIFFIGFISADAQIYTKKATDSVFDNHVVRLFKNGQLQESLELCKKVIREYESLNADEDAAKAYLFAANTSSNLYRIKESMHYLDLALEKCKDLDNPSLNARIYGECGRNYNALGFNEKAIENYSIAIDIAKGNPKANAGHLQYFYGLRSVIHEENKNIKAFYKDIQNAHKASSNTFTASRIAKYFISYNKDLDSAKYYLDLGKKIYETKKIPVYQKSVLQRNFGRYYMERKDFAKAIECYEEALEICKQLKKPQDVRDIHKLLYEAHKASQNNTEAIENLEKYTSLNDSLATVSTQIQEIPVKKLIKEKEEVSEKSKTQLYLIIAIILFLSAGIFIFLKIKYSKKSRADEEKLYSKEEENSQLQLKVNEAFEEIILLAKSNSPEFFTRFQEIYPEVISKLLQIDSKLRVSELTLCSYIFLGFTTKDIATFTFRTLSTVRNRKHNLRTKLNIPAEESTELWFKNLAKK